MPAKNVPWTTLIAALPFDEWPGVLPRSAADPVLPMAVGMSDILAQRLPDGGQAALRKALNRYCNSTSYLSALAADGAQRHDIDGNPAGQVSQADRLSAAVWLLSRSLDRVAKADTPIKAKTVTEAGPLMERARAVVGKNGRPILSLKKAG